MIAGVHIFLWKCYLSCKSIRTAHLFIWLVLSTKPTCNIYFPFRTGYQLWLTCVKGQRRVCIILPSTMYPCHFRPRWSGNVRVSGARKWWQRWGLGCAVKDMKETLLFLQNDLEKSWSQSYWNLSRTNTAYAPKMNYMTFLSLHSDTEHPLFTKIWYSFPPGSFMMGSPIRKNRLLLEANESRFILININFASAA